MKKITNTEYIANYDEIIEIINQGYYPIRDLRIAIGEKLLSNHDHEIRTYIDHKNKRIDIFDNVISIKMFGKITYRFFK